MVFFFFFFFFLCCRPKQNNSKKWKIYEHWTQKMAELLLSKMLFGYYFWCCKNYTARKEKKMRRTILVNSCVVMKSRSPLAVVKNYWREYLNRVKWAEEKERETTTKNKNNQWWYGKIPFLVQIYFSNTDHIKESSLLLI